jgi:hypothetical protein
MDYAIRSWYLLVPWANLCFFALTTFLKWFHLAVHYKTLASIDIISRGRRAAAPKGPSNIHLSPFFTSYISMELIVNFCIFSSTQFREFSLISMRRVSELPVRTHKLLHRGMYSYVDLTVSSFNIFSCILLFVPLLRCVLLINYGWFITMCLLISKLDYLWSCWL